jgi:hypothetical protein
MVAVRKRRNAVGLSFVALDPPCAEVDRADLGEGQGYRTVPLTRQPRRPTILGRGKATMRKCCIAQPSHSMMLIRSALAAAMIRGVSETSVPQSIKAAIVAWEIMTLDQRTEWLRALGVEE